MKSFQKFSFLGLNAFSFNTYISSCSFVKKKSIFYKIVYQKFSVLEKLLYIYTIKIKHIKYNIMQITKQTKANSLNQEQIQEFNHLLHSAIVDKIKQYTPHQTIKNLVVNINNDKSYDKNSYLIFATSDIFEIRCAIYSTKSENTIETILSQMDNTYGVEKYVTQKFTDLVHDSSLNFAGIEPLGYDSCETYYGKPQKVYDVHKYFIDKNCKFINLYDENYMIFNELSLTLDNKTLNQRGNMIWFGYGNSKTFMIYFKTVQDARDYLTKLHENQLSK